MRKSHKESANDKILSDTELLQNSNRCQLNSHSDLITWPSKCKILCKIGDTEGFQMHNSNDQLCIHRIIYLNYCSDPKFSDRQAWTNSVDLEEQSDQSLQYLPFHLHLLDTLLRATLFEFKGDYSNFSDVRIFRILEFLRYCACCFIQ